MFLFPLSKFIPRQLQITKTCSFCCEIPHYCAKYQKQIETEWNPLVRRSLADLKLNDNQLNVKGKGAPKYILSMFPYPSGKLHMGHVRVYTLSDAFAKFYHMNGYSVIHPMGWDSFGLPAENAAIERAENPATWTWSNIDYMRRELNKLGCSFDWHREIATCHPSYYKWTQYIFLRLLRSGLAYQKEAFVNWDPVDKTVLANEQVDAHGLSWRSGAKVEKKKLKQWFIKTTSFSEDLYKDVDDPMLVRWRDVAVLQKSWIGEVTGYALDADLVDETATTCNFISLWLSSLSSLVNIEFVGIHPDHELNDGVQYKVKEPLNDRLIPILVSRDLPFAKGSNVYIEVKPDPDTTDQEVLRQLEGRGVRVYRTSSGLSDWLISRQRYWGTPIPVVHCDKCGSVGVAEGDLPVQLPQQNASMLPLAQLDQWTQTRCPKCDGPATRETDTMDTFVDSSWYYLRYLDPANKEEMLGEDIAKACLPVDLYVGGSGHAVRHLYYARFMHKFLVKEGLAFYKEPFQELIVVGHVKNTIYTVRSTGKFLHRDDVDTSVRPPVERATGQVVNVDTAKMSKSKHNGVEPQKVFDEWGVDVARLVILSAYGPQCHRLWSDQAIEGSALILKSFWAIVHAFEKAKATTRTLPPDACQHSEFLRERRNITIAEVTWNNEKTRQLDLSFKCLQTFMSNLWSVPMEMASDSEYERCLKALIVMLYIFCPHISAHAWRQINSVCESDLGTIFEQAWPQIDVNFKRYFSIKVNEERMCELRLDKEIYDSLSLEKAQQYAQQSTHVQKALKKSAIKNIYLKYHGYHVTCLKIFTTNTKRSRKRK